MNLIFIVLTLLVAGAAAILVGTFILIGLPWTLILLGFLLFGAALVLRRGLVVNG